MTTAMFTTNGSCWLLIFHHRVLLRWIYHYQKERMIRVWRDSLVHDHSSLKLGTAHRWHESFLRFDSPQWQDFEQPIEASTSRQVQKVQLEPHHWPSTDHALEIARTCYSHQPWLTITLIHSAESQGPLLPSVADARALPKKNKKETLHEDAIGLCFRMLIQLCTHHPVLPYAQLAVHKWAQLSGCELPWTTIHLSGYVIHYYTLKWFWLWPIATCQMGIPSLAEDGSTEGANWSLYHSACFGYTWVFP